ncbi:MAG TPA: sialidase family protein [Thermoanaerobaculia bacterium]|nr:sialidase family protein [Thermoanaerobaculia bacterium]
MIRILVILLFGAVSAVADPSITVGENRRISRDDAPYVEPSVACNSARAGNCIAVATRFDASKPVVAVALMSTDGGSTWAETMLATGRVEHAIDAWVTFSPTGVAYAVFLVIEPGDPRTRIILFRSSDGGASWTRRSRIASEHSFDRPTVIARGRDVVIAAEHRNAIAILRSRDDGRTFSAPRVFRPSTLGHNAMNPLWRGDSVVVPYVDYGEPLASARIAVVDTRDFGRTWGTPRVIADVPRRFSGNAHFATTQTGIAGAIASGTADARTVSIVASIDDKWREPVRVSSAGSPAFRPAIAVSSRGDIGATWIEVEAGCTRLWFSVSQNEGRTFSKPAPVSEDLSCGNQPANRSAYERWEHGGDYYGLAADGETFLAIWPDARGGTFQLYAATITVTP